MLFDKTPGRQLVDQRAIDRGVKLPIDGIKRLLIAERGELETALHQTLASTIEFVVYEQAQEIERAKTVGACLLRAYVAGIGDSAKAELP